MGVNSNLILWIHSFLTNRKQFVNFNGTKSDVIIVNTGAPQGCVLSAVLFTVYTADCRSDSDKVVIVKYADDTVIIGLLSNDDEQYYRDEVCKFSSWCEENFLDLNIKKTKEMIIDYRTGDGVVSPLLIEDEKVETVDEYVYLGNVIDNKLKRGENVSKIVKKANKRLYFLRKLKSLHVDKTILTIFYRSIVQSVLTFCIIDWYACITSADKKKLNRIVRNAKKLGCEVQDLESLYKKTACVKVKKIMKDPDHMLHSCFNMLPSGSRMRSIYSRTNRFRNSFVLTAIRLYNGKPM